MTLIETGSETIPDSLAAEPVELPQTTIIDANTLSFDARSAQSFGLPNATHLRRFLLGRSLFMTMPAFNGETFQVTVRPPMNAEDARTLGGFCLERDIDLGIDCDLNERAVGSVGASSSTEVPETYDPGVMILEPRHA